MRVAHPRPWRVMFHGLAAGTYVFAMALVLARKDIETRWWRWRARSRY